MRKPKPRLRQPSLDPQVVSKDVWYYEERRSICIVVDGQSRFIYIPWLKLDASCKRWRAWEREQRRKKR